MTSFRIKNHIDYTNPLENPTKLFKAIRSKKPSTHGGIPSQIIPDCHFFHRIEQKDLFVVDCTEKTIAVHLGFRI